MKAIRISILNLIFLSFYVNACSNQVSIPLSDSLNTPLTSLAGDPLSGKNIFIKRDKGHCVLCHTIAGLKVEFQGNIGPPLSNVGARLTEGQIRLRLIDYERVKPGTLMPSYYRTDALNQVEQKYIGETLLSEQDIEDLTAYLKTLKTELNSEE